MNFPAFSFPHLPGRNDPCWCGSGRKYKSCHCAFDQQIASLAAQGHIVPTHKMIKTPEQIEKIKESCKINIAVLDEIGKQIHEGMTTAEIDDIVSTMTRDMGGIPAPLNYEGYPYSVCTSVNDQVCHGFPSKHVVLKSGDIINVDCSTILNGYFSDSSRMYCIGDVSDENRKLVQVTKECVELGLAQVKPWVTSGWRSTIMPARTATASCAKSAATAAGLSSTKTRGSATSRSAARKWRLLPA